MARRLATHTFVEQIRQQLSFLRDPTYSYRALQLFVAGVPDPWEFKAEDDFEFHEQTGVLVVRDGPSDPEGNDNAEVPEYVFRLEAVVASQLV
jgi:hypothetical protein